MIPALQSTSRKTTSIILIIFAVAIIFFSALTTRVLFTDSDQYIGVAKEFAGISVSKVRNLPGWIYGVILSWGLHAHQSITTLKLMNTLWLILDAILLYFITKRTLTLFLWVFSPLVWYMAPWVAPHLPVSFFTLLAYALLMRYHTTHKPAYFILSALSLGFCAALWWASTYISAFFILAFFYNKKLLHAIAYTALWAIGFLPRILFDYAYFGIPFISSFRGFGSNFVFFFGIAQNTPLPLATMLTNIILFFFIITPLLYLLVKTVNKKNAPELTFIILSALLFFLNFQLRYFIILAPFIFILITPHVTKKSLYAHILISLLIIAITTHAYFGNTRDYQIMQDLRDIERDFGTQTFIVGAEGLSEEQAHALNALYWENNKPFFARYTEYALAQENQTLFKEYSMETRNTINNLRHIKFIVQYHRTDTRTYDDVNHWIIIGNQGQPPEEFELAKTYQHLRVFTKHP